MQAKTVRLCGHGGHVLAVPCIKRFNYQTAGGPAIAVAIHRCVRNIVSGEYGRGYAVSDIASGRRIARLATLKRLPVAEMVADATEAINEVVARVGLERFHAIIASAPALPAESTQAASKDAGKCRETY